ncbi:MAG: hypothetical protein ABR572_03000, partial [Cryomorphaceae bacterium]
MAFCCAILFVVSACNDASDDVIEPEIVRYSISNDTLAAGADNLVIDVEATDNAELSQIRFRVEEAFAKNFGHWRVVRIEDVSGLSHQAVYSFPVPDTALAGLYEVNFQVVDIRGNASRDSIQRIAITQEGNQPVFSGFTTVPPPEPSGAVVLLPNDTITFEGAIGDALGLETIEFEFRGSGQNVLSSRSYVIPDSVDNTGWDAAEADSVFFETFSEKPFSLTVKALNTEGHQSR